MDHMFELYEQVKDDVKFFIASDVRAKILISLKYGSKNLAYLRKDIHLSSSTILHGMSQLETKQLIFRESGNYSLSQKGEIAADKLIDLVKSVYSLNKFESLFLHHDISAIPTNITRDIGCLESSLIIKATETDIMKPQDVRSALISKSKNIKHLSSVFDVSTTQIFLNTLENGGNVHLVLTEGIMEKLFEKVPKKVLQKWLKKGSLKLWKLEGDVKISLTTGDNFMAMGLFSTNGAYDLNVALISQEEDALYWGNCLYDHHLKHASKYSL
ncbi:MAG: transcriptional regulator [Methanobacteriales archaeon Met13]